MAATKVLVVDDDLNIQRVLVFTLKQEGFEVLVASDGQAGVQLAKESTPDLILMDAAMPKLDGYAATQQIRAAEEAGQRVPIIILTSEADVAERVKGLRAGADDDIVKPFHLPWERLVLSTRRREASAIWVADPDVEMLLLLVRAALRLSGTDRRRMRRGSARPSGHFLREFAWLRERIDPGRVTRYAGRLLG